MTVQQNNNNQVANKSTDKKVWQTPKIIEVISCKMTAGSGVQKGDMGSKGKRES